MRWSHMFYFTGLPGWMRWAYFPGAAGGWGRWLCCPPWMWPLSLEREKEWLSAWAKALEEELTVIRQRLNELDKEKP
ncbi:MAG: DUF5320 domain-containing protein [Candidatus Bipolaricaulaceae bacterium]